MRIALLLSGGVDSSYCAYLLQQEGHEVMGIYLKLHDDEAKHTLNLSNIHTVAHHLGITAHVIDAKTAFKANVYDLFVEAYQRGLTPNPCALCNPYMKFGLAFEHAMALGCEKIATGHYARIEKGHIEEALDATKDQSYFLFGLKKEVIARVLFPLGTLIKEEIKPIAFATLPWLGDLQSYKESQEICFVDETYLEILKRHVNTDVPGVVKNEAGKVIGTHLGYMHYTIGKRKGLSIHGALDPHYVLAIDAQNNTLIAGKKEALQTTQVVAQNFSLPLDFQAGYYGIKVRYRSPKTKAYVYLEGERIVALLEEPVYGVASGQALVVYEEALVLGGGWIET